MDHVGRSGGFLLGWSRNVTIYQILSSSFCIEVEFETLETKGKMWGVFVYANNKEKVKGE